MREALIGLLVATAVSCGAPQQRPSQGEEMAQIEAQKSELDQLMLDVSKIAQILNDQETASLQMEVGKQDNCELPYEQCEKKTPVLPDLAQCSIARMECYQKVKTALDSKEKH